MTVENEDELKVGHHIMCGCINLLIGREQALPLVSHTSQAQGPEGQVTTAHTTQPNNPKAKPICLEGSAE
jgi:hypothetical protein